MMSPPRQRQRQGRWGDRRAASQQPEPPRGDPRGDYVVRGAAPPAAKRSGDRRNVMRFVERETARVEAALEAEAKRALHGGARRDGSAARSARAALATRAARGHRSPERRSRSPEPYGAASADFGGGGLDDRVFEGLTDAEVAALYRGCEESKADETATTCVSPPPPRARPPASPEVNDTPRRVAYAEAAADDEVLAAFEMLQAENAALRHELARRGPETDDAPPAPAPRPASPPEVEVDAAPPRGRTRRVSIFASHEAAIADAIGERCASTGSTKCLGDLERAIAARHRRGFVDAADVHAAFRAAGFGGVARRDVAEFCEGLEADERGRVDAREIARLLRDVALEHAGDGPVLRYARRDVDRSPSPRPGSRGYRSRSASPRPRFARTAPVDDAEDELYDALAGRQGYRSRPWATVDALRDRDRERLASRLRGRDAEAEEREMLAELEAREAHGARHAHEARARQLAALQALEAEEREKLAALEREELEARGGRAAALRAMEAEEMRKLAALEEEERALLAAERAAQAEPRRAAPAARRGAPAWALSAPEADATIRGLRRLDVDGTGVLPVGAIARSVPAKCLSRLLELLPSAKHADPANRRVADLARRLRSALTRNATSPYSRVAVDVREMMDDEPQLFGEGSREAFRECVRRVAKPVTQADVDALFHLVDDDRDGVASKRELIHFARDPGGEWTRRSGLAKLDEDSPRGGHRAAPDAAIDEAALVPYEPLVRALVHRAAAPRHHPHLRAVAARVARFLAADDGYEPGHAGKARQRPLLEPLYRSLERLERKHGRALAWRELLGVLRGRGVLRALSARDVDLLKTEFADDGGAVDWRSLLTLCERAAHEDPDSNDRAKRDRVTKSAAKSLLDAATRDRVAARGDDPRDAFAASLRRLFADMDANRDGVLSKREIRDALSAFAHRDRQPFLRPHQLQTLFDVIDLDGDDRISYPELVEFLIANVDKF